MWQVYGRGVWEVYYIRLAGCGKCMEGWCVKVDGKAGNLHCGGEEGVGSV
jgi:hypothetical protein